MSTRTEILNLFKWDVTDATDKASKFNIPLSMNGNWDNIDEFAGLIQDSIGTATNTFSTSSTYAVGDIVIYEHKLYKCTTAVSTAGEFDSDDWTEISIKELIDEKTVVDSSLSPTSKNPVQNKEVYEALEEKQTQIDALVEENTTLKAQIPTGHKKTDSVQLTDSAEGLAIENVAVWGGMSQETYEGKNMLSYESKSVTQNGLSINAEKNGVISLKGTTTATINVGIDLEPIKVVGEYKLSGYTRNDNYVQLYYKDVNGTLKYKAFKDSPTINFEEGDTLYQIFVYINAVGTTLNEKLYLQLESGSTAHDWEPYCGGKSSPNKDYPQTIHKVTGNCNVKFHDMNLLNSIVTSQTTKGVTITRETDGSITLNGTSNDGFNLILTTENYPNKQYRIKSEINGYFYYSTSNKIWLACTQNQIHLEITSDSNAQNINKTVDWENIRYWIPNGTTFNNCNIKTILTEGTEDKSYVPYLEQNSPLTLGNIELYEGDKIQISYVNQAGYKKVTGANVVKKIKERVLTGIENWVSQSPTGFYRYGLNISEIINDNSLSDDVLIYSNYFKGVSFADRQTDTDETIYIVCNGLSGNNGFFINTKEFSTVESFKTWLSTHTLEVCYPLATPTTTPITDTTLLSQLETLINMETYKGITNIDTEGEDLAPVLEFTYCRDLDTILNRLDSIEARLDLLEE